MAMYDSELSMVVSALDSACGRPLQAIKQPRRDRLVLSLAGGVHLLLVPRGPFARLHSIARPPTTPQKPFSFQGACRAHLTGRLDTIVKTEDDRIVDLVFGAHHLHLRLTGRGGGLWLCKGSEVIAAYDGPAPDALPELPDSARTSPPPRFAPEVEETWDLAARRWLGGQEATAEVEQLRTSVRRDLKQLRGRTQRLLDNLDRDLEKASRAPTYRRQADTLAANLHTLAKRSELARLPDLEDPEIVHEIALDPALPPVQTMEKLYAKARRLDRSADRVLEQLDAAEARQQRVDEALSRVPTADVRELRELAMLVPPKAQRKKDDEVVLPWHTWYGPSGRRILVGRNSAGNRRLSFQVSRGDDIWLHLRGKPGAHVLIPMVKGTTAPLELLLTGAQIVLTHAGVPEGATADVQYTTARNVRSIPGDNTGKVLLADERVLHVQRDPSLLADWQRR